jgi:hypothetical protein
MDKNQTFFLTKSIIQYTSRLTLRHFAGRQTMKVALLMGVLLADMLIGFYGLGGYHVNGAASQVDRSGQVKSMDEVWPPPPPPPSYP